ncbi:hypothetical protein [uncultured Parasphingopyxis sp.]|uniref:hypothetical protein n=1 Tax=uncultured Parasphingopyxis sp. TaxID=1547918 RepID=UPI0026361A88|nr:hypothetical protein [uncultured Parasphingopyxis sp.]
MIRVLLGSVLGAVAMFVLGFIFYGALGSVPLDDLGDSEAAAVQSSLAANMGELPAGAYVVPGTGTQNQERMFTDGPIATIQFNPAGFETMDATVLLGGFVHMLISALILGAALYAVSAHVRSYSAKLSIVVLFGLAASVFMHLGNPIWWHQGWLYHLWLFFADFVSFVAAGAIIAWFLPERLKGESRKDAEAARASSEA